MKSILRFPFRPALAVALGALTLSACVNEVREDPGQSEQNLEPCSGEGCPVTEPPSQAVAMLYGEIPWSSPESGSSSVSSGSGGGIDPNTLYIFLRDDAASCADPNAALACGSHWDVTIGIPPHLQQPGVLSLSSPDLISVFSATGPGAADCWWGGGSFFDGTIEIVSIGEDELVVTLAGTATYDFDANGTYTVPRCL